jgi:ADP-ribosylglycohydrolase
MRIAPHILWANGPGDLVRRVVRDGIATHGHPRALVGALVYAFALAQAASSRTMHGFGDSVGAAAAGLVDVDQILPELPPGWGTNQVLDAFMVTWRQATRETSQLLALVADSLNRGAMSNPDEILERIGCADPKINGAGTVSAAAAIYLASRFAARPQDGLLSAAFLRKADTDTLASLTAGILGALHDTRWLGNLAAGVQDADYITRLAERSAARATEPTWPTSSPLTLRRQLTSALLRHLDVSGEFPDGRQCRLIDMAPLSDGRVLRACLRLSDGQTVFADLRADPSAGPDGDGRERPGRQPRPREPELAQPRGEHGAPAASGRRTATAERVPPTAAPQLSGPEVGVILATSNLAQSAAFYARLTGRRSVAESDQLAVHPPVPPPGVLCRDADHEFADRSRRARPPGTPAARVVQLARGQPPVPGEQRRPGHRKHLTPPAARDQSRQRRQPQPVGRLVADPADLAVQDRVLVPEHQDFGVLGHPVPRQHRQAAEQAAYEQVEDGNDHSSMIPAGKPDQARSNNRAPQDNCHRTPGTSRHHPVSLAQRGCRRRPQVRCKNLLASTDRR